MARTGPSSSGRTARAIVTVTDEEGELIRRTRIDRDGREVVIIDNTLRDRRRADSPDGYRRAAAAAAAASPRERYIVDADQADEALIYETITAPPIAAIPRRYTLSTRCAIRRICAPACAASISSTINFDAGSWQVSPDRGRRLAVDRRIRCGAPCRSSPNEVFLVEGHTDAVGPTSTISRSRTAGPRSVAEIPTRDFQIPPENLTTQGYGEQYLKVQSAGGRAREPARDAPAHHAAAHRPEPLILTRGCSPGSPFFMRCGETPHSDSGSSSGGSMMGGVAMKISVLASAGLVLAGLFAPLPAWPQNSPPNVSPRSRGGVLPVCRWRRRRMIRATAGWGSGRANASRGVQSVTTGRKPVAICRCRAACRRSSRPEDFAFSRMRQGRRSGSRP